MTRNVYERFITDDPIALSPPGTGWSEWARGRGYEERRQHAEKARGFLSTRPSKRSGVVLMHLARKQAVAHAAD